jgi:hypothetical protein
MNDGHAGRHALKHKEIKIMAFMIMLTLKAGALIRNGSGRRRMWLWLPVKAALWALMVMIAWGSLPATFVSPGPVSVQAVELAEPREGSGNIDYIDQDRIVIDDSAYLLSELVVYYKNSYLREQVASSKFKVGRKVGYTVHTNGEIIELWLE